MTRLYRCRGSLLEIAARFSARTAPEYRWHGTVWPGGEGLIVTTEAGARRVRCGSWEPAASGRRGRSLTLFPRQLMARLDQDARPAMRRCLIVADSFALPFGDKGARKRCWFGHADLPLVARAGICTDEPAPRYQGVLVPPNILVARVGAAMPAILDPGDEALWLDGPLADAWRLLKPFPAQDMWVEPTDERWADGQIPNAI